MLLIKVVFFSILIQYGLAGSYFGRGNGDTVGKITLKENYKSIIKKLHQYLKDDLNMELLRGIYNVIAVILQMGASNNFCL